MEPFKNMILITDHATPVKDSEALPLAEEFVRKCKEESDQTLPLLVCQDLVMTCLRGAVCRAQMEGRVGVRVGVSQKVWPIKPQMDPGFWDDIREFMPAFETAINQIASIARMRRAPRNPQQGQ